MAAPKCVGVVSPALSVVRRSVAHTTHSRSSCPPLGVVISQDGALKRFWRTIRSLRRLRRLGSLPQRAPEGKGYGWHVTCYVVVVAMNDGEPWDASGTRSCCPMSFGGVAASRASRTNVS